MLGKKNQSVNVFPIRDDFLSGGGKSAKSRKVILYRRPLTQKPTGKRMQISRLFAAVSIRNVVEKSVGVALYESIGMLQQRRAVSIYISAAPIKPNSRYRVWCHWY